MAIIDKPTDYFQTTTYAGGTTDISSLDFQPDFVWAKKRSGAENHGLFDSVRGATKTLTINDNAAESTRSGSLTSFDSDGWTMGGSDGIISASGNTYVGWAWKAGGSASSNTAGSITSSVSANQEAGFSVVSYTAVNANATVGHGLGVKPDVLIVKQRSASGQGYATLHPSFAITQFVRINETDALRTSTDGTGNFNSTVPTSSVFSIGTAVATGGSTATMIAYCFAEKQGYSKFGRYQGNGVTDGPYIHTGFKTAWVLIKNITNADQWVLFDYKREGYNPDNDFFQPNSSNQEGTEAGAKIDLLSNGFKLRGSGGGIGQTNNNGNTFIYMAFAENPFVTSTDNGSIPATAR
tara:strand:+ start:1402 stop:2457 length:1056 start_codon:yes stop_codon:yes gene_type:complete